MGGMSEGCFFELSTEVDHLIAGGKQLQRLTEFALPVVLFVVVFRFPMN